MKFLVEGFLRTYYKMGRRIPAIWLVNYHVIILLDARDIGDRYHRYPLKKNNSHLKKKKIK